VIEMTTQAERDRATLAYLASQQRTQDIANQAREEVQATERAQSIINWLSAAAVTVFVVAYLIAFS
jgi:hypothetical protein